MLAPRGVIIIANGMLPNYLISLLCYLFYLLEIQLKFVDWQYYCVIGVLPNYGMTLSFDFCTYWRFNESPYWRFNESPWLVLWLWLIMMIGVLPNYGITLSSDFCTYWRFNEPPWLVVWLWLIVMIDVLPNYWIGLRIWCLISGLKWTRLVHFLIWSGSSLKAFAPKLQSENLALSLEMR